jgi:protein-S-isoprenylcysteine O-methyltransferase Ste14
MNILAPPLVERMSEKKREWAAVEPGQKIWPMYMVVVMTVFYLGGLGIMRSLNILYPKGMSFTGDIIHLVGALFLCFSTLTQKDACAGKRKSSLLVV